MELALDHRVFERAILLCVSIAAIGAMATVGVGLDRAIAEGGGTSAIPGLSVSSTAQAAHFPGRAAEALTKPLEDMARAAQVIAISQFTLGKAQQTNGVTAAQGRVLYNCLDPEFHQVATTRPGPPRLLTVARMSLAEQYKGHDYVIRAMPALLAHFPDLTYHIIGDGDARPGLAQLAAETGVSQAIHFHGFVSAAELQRHYEAATIYIMPSQAEGFGFVFLEAMSHGLPVIAGNQDATPEVVADGETGLLVDPTSVPAITTAAARLLADDGLRRQMGQAGRRRVQQQFSFDQFQQTLLTYLAELRPVRARA